MTRVLSIPSHGEVVNIGGREMTSNIKETLLNCLLSSPSPSVIPTLPDETLYAGEGLAIWNEIIFTPEFYQTHDEMAMFDIHGCDLVNEVRPGTTLMDLGAGDTRKVERLLSAFENAGVPVKYYALDISESSLKHNVGYLHERHSNPGSVVTCAGLWGTFEDGLGWAQKLQGPRVFLSLGSVLCNDPWPEALRKVRLWASILRPEDMLLVGMDAHVMPDNEEKIWKAYHTRPDLFRQFFLNGFDHINRLVGDNWLREDDWEILATLEIPTRHRFFFRAKRDITLRYREDVRVIKQGEELDWFDSHKYDQKHVEMMFEKAGLVASKIWQAPDSEFRQYLVRLKSTHNVSDADSAVSGLSDKGKDSFQG